MVRKRKDWKERTIIPAQTLFFWGYCRLGIPKYLCIRFLPELNVLWPPHSPDLVSNENLNVIAHKTPIHFIEELKQQITKVCHKISPATFFGNWEWISTVAHFLLFMKLRVKSLISHVTLLRYIVFFIKLPVLKTFLSFWNFKVVPSFGPYATSLKFLNQRRCFLNGLNTYFTIFQNSNAFPT